MVQICGWRASARDSQRVFLLCPRDSAERSVHRARHTEGPAVQRQSLGHGRTAHPLLCRSATGERRRFRHGHLVCWRSAAARTGRRSKDGLDLPEPACSSANGIADESAVAQRCFKRPHPRRARARTGIEAPGRKADSCARPAHLAASKNKKWVPARTETHFVLGVVLAVDAAGTLACCRIAAGL